ncbi:putative Outer membrane protein [Tenacibaculum litopenaei]
MYLRLIEISNFSFLNRIALFLLFFLSSFLCYSQESPLLIQTKNPIHQTVLDSLKLTQKSIDKKQLSSHLQKTQATLQRQGYFNSDFKILQHNDTTKIIVTLGQRVPRAKIKWQQKYYEMPMEKVSHFLREQTIARDALGESFAKLQLTHIRIHNNCLEATLTISNQTRRHIDKITIKGYENFPRSFLKHRIALTPGKIVSKKELQRIHKRLNNLNFSKSIKTPALLFSKDSTVVYLYLEKKQHNSIDGMLNLGSKPKSSGIQLNGHLDLQLNNILNTGEQFRLNWKSFNSNQNFSLRTDIPYLFNSSISARLQFSIHRQDSSFVNSKFNTALTHQLNPKTQVGLSYEQQESTETLLPTGNQNNALASFNSQFIGALVAYQLPNENFLWSPYKHSLIVNPAIGSRGNTRQYKLVAEGSAWFEINEKNAILTKGRSGYLRSPNLFNNELFRMGGINSLRGFNEQSIFTHLFASLQTEYQFLVSPNQILYSITDIAYYKSGANYKSALGLGLGYKQQRNNTLLSISYAIGKTSDDSFDFKKSFLNIKIINFF